MESGWIVANLNLYLRTEACCLVCLHGFEELGAGVRISIPTFILTWRSGEYRNRKRAQSAGIGCSSSYVGAVSFVTLPAVCMHRRSIVSRLIGSVLRILESAGSEIGDEPGVARQE